MTLTTIRTTDAGCIAALVAELVRRGADPNVLQTAFEEGIEATLMWVLWGDGRWRENWVCSKCGSLFSGICCDPGTTGEFWSGDKGYHRNQPGVTVIPFTEWEALHAS